MKKHLSYMALFILLGCSPGDKPIQLVFQDLPQEREDRIVDLLEAQEEFSDFTWEVVKEPTGRGLLFSTRLEAFEEGGVIANEELKVGILPSSFRVLGQSEAGRIALPLEADHIELLFHKGFLAGQNLEAPYPDWRRLMDQVKSLSGGEQYPMIVAGKEDRDLVRLLALLINAQEGSSGVSLFGDALESRVDLGGVLEKRDPLGRGLVYALDQLVQWKEEGVLHPEWIRFDREVVDSFWEDGLVGVTVMSLWEHRKKEQRIIENYLSVPVFSQAEQGQGGDLIAPMLFVGILGDHREDPRLTSILNSLIQKGFQENLTFSSGLAPVNANSVPLDKQASDLRFWIASANGVFPEYPEGFLNLGGNPLLEDIRQYLLARR